MVQQREIWSRYSSAISLSLLPPPFYTFCYSIFSPFLSRSRLFFLSLSSFSFLYIYIYKSLLLYFLISGAWRREETIFGGGGEATQQKGNQLRSFSFQGTKACLEALPDDSTKRRFLLCRKLPRGVFLNSAASIFFNLLLLPHSSRPPRTATTFLSADIQNKNFNIRVPRVRVVETKSETRVIPRSEIRVKENGRK